MSSTLLGRRDLKNPFSSLQYNDKKNSTLYYSVPYIKHIIKSFDFDSRQYLWFMKYIVSISLIAVLISCGNKIEEEKKIKETIESRSENQMNKNLFSSDYFPVSFSFPSNWEIMNDTTLNMVHVLSPTSDQDFFQEMVNIVVGGTNGKDLDAFFEGNLRMIQGMFEELEQTEEPNYQEINGVQFKKVRYNYLFEGLPLTAQLYVTIKADNSFIINCSALQNTFDSFEEEFISIIHSIAISSPQLPSN